MIKIDSMNVKLVFEVRKPTDNPYTRKKVPGFSNQKADRQPVELKENVRVFKDYQKTDKQSLQLKVMSSYLTRKTAKIETQKIED